MKSVGSDEAKTHLPHLLDQVTQGESITITRRGKPIARLVPAPPTETPDVAETVEAMLAFRDQHGPTLGDGETVRDLIEEGHR